MGVNVNFYYLEFTGNAQNGNQTEKQRQSTDPRFKSHNMCFIPCQTSMEQAKNEKGKQMMYKTPTVMTHCLSADYAIILKCWEEVSEMKLKGSQSHSHGVVLKLSSSEIRYYL